MPLNANLLKLESSILPRAKRATNRNNVATDNESKKKFWRRIVPAPKCPAPNCPAPNRRRRVGGAETYPTPDSWPVSLLSAASSRVAARKYAIKNITGRNRTPVCPIYLTSSLLSFDWSECPGPVTILLPAERGERVHWTLEYSLNTRVTSYELF